MTRFIRFFIATVCIWCVPVSGSALPPPPPRTDSVSAVVDLVVPASARCPEWWALAKFVGWSSDLLPKLDYVIWRESRCLANAYFKGDPNGGSHGLTQINGFWCRGSRYYPNGYLQHFGVLRSCKDLYKPKVNLYAALLIYRYGNSWRPWSLQ